MLLRVDKPKGTPGETLLEVEDLHVVDDRGLEAVRGVSFKVRAGEILGIAGVDGNGQTELIDAITGLRRASGGRVLVAGRDLTHGSAHEFLQNGVGHIPEDRHRRGLVLEFSLAENLVLHDYAKEPFASRGFLHLGQLLAYGEEAARRVRRPRRQTSGRAPRRCRAATSRRS